jgi:hypothetical protein
MNRLPELSSTARPVPRWARWAAHAVPLAVLPAGLWRILLGLGVPMGFSGELARVYEGPDWVLTPYVIVLSLLAEGCALLTLGLVRPWGEVFPRWLPFVGGRTVPVAGAVAAALLGAVTVMWLCVDVMRAWDGPDFMGNPGAPQGLAGWVMALCYAPMLAWGPLLVVVTFAYYRRRRGALTPSPTAAPGRT